MTREEIIEKVVETLSEEFEVEKETIKQINILKDELNTIPKERIYIE